MLGTWRGIIGPPGLTREQIAFWNDVLAKAMKTEIWKQALRDNDWEADYLDCAGTKKLLDAEYAKYRSILADLGLIKEK